MPRVADAEGIGMKFVEYVRKDNVVELDATSKADAIRQLVTHLGANKDIADEHEVLERVMERESLEPTSLGHGIAIPHARSRNARGLVCVVGRLKKPIDFLSFDGTRVKLIFLTLYPHEEAPKYLFFISGLCQLLSDPKARKVLLGAKTPAEIYSALREAGPKTAARGTKKSKSAGTVPAVEFSSEDVEIALLIRLQRLENLKRTETKGKRVITAQTNKLRSCIDEDVLAYFDRLVARSGIAVVAVEGGTCQGCNLRLPTKFVQQLRRGEKTHFCPSCRRFLFDTGAS
jgi:PTS system nitrogen regulatory IIA component